MGSKVKVENLKEPSSYSFTWIIEEFGHLLADCTWLNEIRSPMFTANNLDYTSWSLRFSFKIGIDIATYSCDLLRDLEDEGNQKVEVHWMIEINFEGDFEHVKKKFESTDVFKKGDCCRSETFCTSSDQFKRPVPFTIKCHLKECHMVQQPSYGICIIHTKTDYFSWIPRNILQKKKFYGNKGTNFIVCLSGDNGQVKIRIYRRDNISSQVCYLMCNISLFDENSMISSEDVGELRDTFGETSVLEFPTTLQLRKVFLPYVTIRVHFFCSVLIESKYTEFQENCIRRHASANLDFIGILRQDFLSMYESKRLADVKLQIGTDIIPAHRCILSARSPVFYDMFDYNIENQTEIVEIADVDVETMNLLLKFMYTGDSDEIDDENALKLLLAADKFEVYSLKEKCSSYLETILCEENVCEVLNTADKVKQGCLKMVAIDYVRKRASKILLSENWKRLVELNVNLVSEILSTLSADLGTAAQKSTNV